MELRCVVPGPSRLFPVAPFYTPVVLGKENQRTHQMQKNPTKQSSFAEGKPTFASPTSDADFVVFNSFASTPKQHSTFERIRQTMREPIAEFAGVAIFVFFGVGVNCQVALSTNPGVASSPHGDFLSVNFGWAAGLALGAWIAGGISGGHLNPAFTLAMATWRGFPWRKVPGYIFAQVLGALSGAAIVYGNYLQAINIFEGGEGLRTRASASLFATYALDYLSGISCFFDEFIGTALLVLMIAAATDKHNMAPSKGLLPLALFFMILGLGLAIGMQTSYAFNPARDFGPRLFLTFLGYGGQLYTYRNQYWLWCPVIAPLLGAQFGLGFYDLLLKKREPADLPESLERRNTNRGLQNASDSEPRFSPV